MAVICPACSSSSTQTLIDKNQCLACGRTFDFAGNLDSVNVQFVVGNFADLQRFGAQKAPDASAPAFELPTGVQADQVYDASTDGTPREAVDAAKAADKATADAQADTSAASSTASSAPVQGDAVTTTGSTTSNPSAATTTTTTTSNPSA